MKKPNMPDTDLITQKKLILDESAIFLPLECSSMAERLKSDPYMTKVYRNKRNRSRYKVIKILVGGVGFVFMFMVVMRLSGIGDKIEASHKDSKIVVETIDAGNIVSVSMDKSFWVGNTTTLTTTKGVFTVNGLLSTIIIGEPLIIKNLKGGDSLLCDVKKSLCVDLN
ncbi:hypothetical protein [Shewanella baltica]|uniref:hypothetical protein n=1 Tax=Shewanella baltica TaxID=62322 RepID=UPI00217DBCCB|nr:hypothetical protein [Shewanella baltica]MCS6162410.1 hypothetical protein [Shewanella baltica]